ncbi:MAG: hypothetical protein IJF43_03835, partial [Firmicutes bacterium]|nr:hypothetical protein [Bacillota bacterium]
THLLENTESYGKLMDLVTENYGSSLDSKREEIKANYEAAGHPLEDSEVDYELMAHFVEEKLLTDKTTVQKLLQKDRSIGQKILDWINNIIQKITGTKEQRMLMDARDLWNKALAENKKAPEDGADKRFSFGGEKALTADLDALANAKDMLKDNQSAEAIFRETGWFVGADGKWRFEIDDSNMVYNKNGRKGNPDQERQKELYNKMFSGTITQEEWEELASLEKNGIRKQKLLEDYIDHQSLFDAYPQLRNINLEFSAEDLGRSGAYNKYDNTITLDAKYKSAPESVLLHEIQHAIQSIEGFSGGTNPEAWAIRDLDGSITKRFADEYKELYAGISRENQNKYQRYKELEFAMGEILYSEKKSDQERMERYEEESDTLYAELYYKPWFLRLDTLYRMLNNTSSLYSYLYRNTAGEIEARDVAKRRNLTANERKEQMPETGNENTVFAESDISNIIKKDKHGVPFVEVTSDILNGVSKKDIPKVLAQIVKTKFNVWVDANGQKIGINKKTANEWRFSENAKWLYRGNKRKFRDKMRTFDNADELLKASRSYIEEEAIHKNYESYARGEVNFRVDGREYNADILVGIDKQNRAFLYDIVNIGTIKIEEAHTTLAENSADRSNGASSMDSISDSSEKSNNRFSIGRADIADKELRDVIKAENRKMKDVFFSRSTVDRNALWDMIYDEEKHIAETGSYRRNVVQDIIDYAYETGYRYKNDDFEPVNSLGKVSIYVSEEYRGEMDSLGGLAEVNKQVFGSGLRFTYKPNQNALDDAYATLQAENQGIMPESMDPSEQVQSIVDVFGRGAYDTLKDLDSDAYDPFAEQDNPYRIDIEQTVQDAMDSIQALAVKKIAEQSRKEGQLEVNRWVAKQMQKEARNYTVGSIVELNGERGTVTERTTKGRNVSYTITFDNGEVRENVKPDELSVAVTPDLYFDELPKDQQEAWQEPPEGWDISRDLADVAPMPIDMKEYREILYENGITVGVRKLNEWFKREGWLKKADRYYYPTQKALDEGYFKREKYGNRITETGQKYFLDLFLGNRDLFADPEETGKLVLPGAKQAKDSPLEDSEVQNMVAEYEDELTTTGEDYAWAQALTGRGVTYSKDYARNFDAAAQ